MMIPGYANCSCVLQQLSKHHTAIQRQFSTAHIHHSTQRSSNIQQQETCFRGQFEFLQLPTQKVIQNVYVAGPET